MPRISKKLNKGLAFLLNGRGAEDTINSAGNVSMSVGRASRLLLSTPLREVVHCVLLGVSCGQGMISVDFQSDPIITGGSYTSPMLATASYPL